MGGVKAEAVSAVVMDHPTVEVFSNAFKKDHGPIEGIVGFPFFARYKMTVDYQAKVLSFTPNGYKPEDVMQSMMKAIMNAQARIRANPNRLPPPDNGGLSSQKRLRTTRRE